MTLPPSPKAKGGGMSAPASEDDLVVDMRGITKRFGGNAVLKGVDFSLRRGEVHALLGENGAGKSTLMKILLGIHAADEGTVSVAGKPLSAGSTRARLDAGVAMIFQELSLVPTMTVAENLFLGREPRRFPFRIDRRDLKRRAAALAAEHGFALDPAAMVEDLTFAQRQLVEILKALSRGASALVMDEPTSALSAHEEAQLHATIAALKERGIGIVYISHRMAEIFRIADRLSVIKDGVMRGPFPIGEITVPEIARMMARTPAGAPERQRETGQRTAGNVVLSVERLSSARKLRDVALVVREGEIVGLAGLVGSGRSTLMKAIFGLLPDARGVVMLAGRDVSTLPARDRIRAGMALVPEDRRHEGLVVEHGLAQNVALPNLADLASELMPGAVRRRRERELFLSFREALSIVCRDPNQPASELSGGNQQKVVFAKWFATRPKLLLLDEPTAGVDVNAKAEMRALVREAAGRGLAVLLVSSELDELADLADRLVVVGDGRIVGRLDSARGEEEIRTLLQEMTGAMEKAA